VRIDKYGAMHYGDIDRAYTDFSAVSTFGRGTDRSGVCSYQHPRYGTTQQMFQLTLQL